MDARRWFEKVEEIAGRGEDGKEGRGGKEGEAEEERVRREARSWLDLVR